MTFNPTVAQMAVYDVVEENPDALPLPFPSPPFPLPRPSSPLTSSSSLSLSLPHSPPLLSVSPGAGDIWWQWPSVLQLGTVLADDALSLCDGRRPNSCDVLWPPYGTLPKPPTGTTLCHHQWHGTSGFLLACIFVCDSLCILPPQ